MKVLSAYKYLLYRIYDWQLSWFGEKNNPKIVAIVGCSLFIYINTMTAIVIFQLISGIKVYIQTKYTVVFMVLLILLNSYIFIHLDKFETLIQKFSKESDSVRKRNKYLCFAYVIFTYLSFFLFVLVLSPSTK